MVNQEILIWEVKILITSSNQFKRNMERKGNKKTIQKLNRECEKAKRRLSAAQEAKVQIEDLVEGLNFSEVLTSQIQRIKYDLFRKTIEPIQTALNDSHLNQCGSSRIPKVRQLVKEFFEGKDPNTRINLDEAICYGAAIQGGLIFGENLMLLVVWLLLMPHL